MVYPPVQLHLASGMVSLMIQHRQRLKRWGIHFATIVSDQQSANAEPLRVVRVFQLPKVLLQPHEEKAGALTLSFPVRRLEKFLYELLDIFSNVPSERKFWVCLNVF
eukprot:m.161981 g.161981  ORF g.161981 m.161981 type:complete len:107 (-) comp24868_c0_seq17:47-367(-)